MRWTPVILVLVAIAIAVIVARGLPEDTSHRADPNTEATPVDDAANAVAPRSTE